MRDEKPAPKARPAAQSREDRLKAALKANMARRKAQMRARATDEGQGGPDRPDKQGNELDRD